MLETVEIAISKYGIEMNTETMIHSDQGAHYTSVQFRTLLKDKELRQSMYRRANCWDNAPQESFYGHMKDEKTGFRTQTMICAPLTLGDLVFGCIQIINKTDGIAFDEKDLSFVERLASEIENLLKHQGLLEDYVAAAESGGLMSSNNTTKAEVSFRTVICAESEKEMEYQLRKLREFAGLRLGEQKEVLRLARELRRYLINAK